MKHIGLSQHTDSLQSPLAHPHAGTVVAALFSETRNQGVHEVNISPISRANDAHHTSSIVNLNALASQPQPLRDAPALALLADAAAEQAAAETAAPTRLQLASNTSRSPVHIPHKQNVACTPSATGSSPNLNDSAYISIRKPESAAVFGLDAQSPTPSDTLQKQLCATLLPFDLDSASDGPATTPLNTPNDSEDELGDCSVQSALFPSTRLKRPLFREDSPEADEQIDQKALPAAESDDDDYLPDLRGTSKTGIHNEHPHVKRKRQGQGNAVHGASVSASTNGKAQTVLNSGSSEDFGYSSPESDFHFGDDAAKSDQSEEYDPDDEPEPTASDLRDNYKLRAEDLDLAMRDFRSSKAVSPARTSGYRPAKATKVSATGQCARKKQRQAR